jgi:AraC family transcriptional regulator, regulatory protein of adaptative response / methylated-DNA-[protein]-cysteine methyltransferase
MVWRTKTKTEVCFATARTALGRAMLAVNRQGVCAVGIGKDSRELRDRLREWFPEASLREDSRSLRRHLGRLVRWLGNPARGLALPLDIRGTVFQRRVWAALQNIPSGTTATYQDVARQIGAPKAARAVANACAANRLALAIPCHRVVRADGSLGGYGWGPERKRALLEAEHAARR